MNILSIEQFPNLYGYLKKSTLDNIYYRIACYASGLFTVTVFKRSVNISLLTQTLMRSLHSVFIVILFKKR